VLPVLAKQKLRIPQDMALIGLDDIDAAPYLPSPMTTVKQPIEELATKALELLLKRITNPKHAKICKIALSTELVVRESCGCSR
jgi:DNA-binding LacI/PurR family transcriptional regulator